MRQYLHAFRPYLSILFPSKKTRVNAAADDVINNDQDSWLLKTRSDIYQKH